MRGCVVGSGGREHALAEALARTADVVVTPGKPEQFAGTPFLAAGQHSADDLLPTIRVPSLVIAAGRDGFTPPERSRAMAAAIPGATLLEIPDASHTAPIERPQLIDEAVRNFLAEEIDRVAQENGATASDAVIDQEKIREGYWVMPSDRALGVS